MKGMLVCAPPCVTGSGALSLMGKMLLLMQLCTMGVFMG